MKTRISSGVLTMLLMALMDIVAIIQCTFTFYYIACLHNVSLSHVLETHVLGDSLLWLACSQICVLSLEVVINLCIFLNTVYMC